MDDVDGWDETVNVVVGVFFENINFLASGYGGLWKMENQTG